MSHYRTKIRYESQGPYGSTETYTLYAHHNLGSDHVTIYDENGDVIFGYDEWSEKNMGKQLIKLLTSTLPLREQDKQDGIEYWTVEDIHMIENAWERNRKIRNTLKYSTPEQLDPGKYGQPP